MLSNCLWRGCGHDRAGDRQCCLQRQVGCGRRPIVRDRCRVSCVTSSSRGRGCCHCDSKVRVGSRHVFHQVGVNAVDSVRGPECKAVRSPTNHGRKRGTGLGHGYRNDGRTRGIEVGQVEYLDLVDASVLGCAVEHEGFAERSIGSCCSARDDCSALVEGAQQGAGFRIVYLAHVGIGTRPGYLQIGRGVVGVGSVAGGGLLGYSAGRVRVHRIRTARGGIDLTARAVGLKRCCTRSRSCTWWRAYRGRPRCRRCLWPGCIHHWCSRRQSCPIRAGRSLR